MKEATTILSESTPIGTVLTLPVGGSWTHCFLGVQMFDANGALIAGGSGTFTVAVKTTVTKRFEAPPTAVISAAAPETIDWDGPVEEVRVTPAGVTGVVTYKVCLAIFKS